MHVMHIQIVANKSALAVYIKQSVLCLRKVDLHAYFTKPVLQVLTFTHTLQSQYYRY